MNVILESLGDPIWQRGWTFSVAWSPNSSRIASGGADTMIHLWNAHSCMR
jgi:WD40 repeat protein